jgi:subtilisin-like proprotein convertase family protein
MNQNGDGTAGEAISDRYTAVGAIVLPITESHFAGALPKPVADYTMTNSGIIIPDDLLISDVNVTLSIAHSNDSDLIIRLRSPAGKYVTLFANRGGSGNNLSHTTFDDQMGRAIGAKHAVPPFTGSFRPEQPLSSFNGTNAQGKWLLQVYDASAGDIGALTSWMLTISGTLGSNSAEMKMMGFPDVLPTGLNTSGGDVKYLAPTEAQPLPTAFPVLETPHATAFTLPTDESVQRSQSPTNSTVSLAESVLRLDSRSEPDTISLTLFDPLAVA